MLTEKQRERRVFERLASIAGLPVVSGSIQQPDPPRPDIECVIDSHSPLAVELVALDAEDTRTRLNNMLATEDAWQAALSLWPADLQTRLRAECQDVSLGLRIHNDAGSRLRTKLLREVQRRLLSLPAGFTGEPFGPGELPDMLLGVQVDRGSARNGPRIIAPSAGPVLPIQIEKLVETLTVRSYDTGLPLELFAYSVHDDVGVYHRGHGGDRRLSVYLPAQIDVQTGPGLRLRSGCARAELASGRAVATMGRQQLERLVVEGLASYIFRLERAHAITLTEAGVWRSYACRTASCRSLGARNPVFLCSRHGGGPVMKASIALVCVAFVAAGLAATASTTASEAEQEVRHSIGTDRFAAGGRVSVNESVTGDLIAAGGDVTLNAEVGGDMVVAGGNVRLAGSGSQGLYAAGGSVDINARIARNARVAGGSVSLGSAGQIAGNATIAGGEVVVRGGIGGYLQAGGGRVYLDGPVGGDVEVAGESIELGPNARIEGRMRYQSQNEISQAAGAEVKGGIERLAGDEAARDGFGRFAGGGLGVAWSLGLVLAAALLAGVLPGLASRLGDTLRQRFGWSMLVGFIALVCIPVAALILLVTLIGAPLAIAAIAGYFALLLTGYVASGVGAGDLALRRWRPERAASTAWRVGAAAVGMFVIVLLGQLPWLGGLVGFVALLLGMGALLMQLRRKPA